MAINPTTRLFGFHSETGKIVSCTADDLGGVSSVDQKTRKVQSNYWPVPWSPIHTNAFYDSEKALLETIKADGI
jgi:hypothetical protein